VTSANLGASLPARWLPRPLCAVGAVWVPALVLAASDDIIIRPELSRRILGEPGAVESGGDLRHPRSERVVTSRTTERASLAMSLEERFGTVKPVIWPPVQAVILDLDGLLIDSEPVWRAAESTVFGGLGIPLSERDLLDSIGQPMDVMIRRWRERQRPDGGPEDELTGAELAGAEVACAELTDDEVADRITDNVIAHIKTEGQPMPGVTATIARFERYGLPLAIASSSPPRLISAVCDRFGLSEIRVRCSGMDEVQAKPAPDVYLTAARRLGVAPASCLALEDSPPGVAAAKGAGMRCLAVPDPLLAGDPRYREADLVIPSLTELNDTILRQLGVQIPDGQDECSAVGWC
jgi:mannitol-1-/sugar-/sorbitol-6-/2-deoxyglucose-6-phosphatase